MGQIEPALSCYKQSATELESDHGFQNASNRAYIRQWIGELLVTKGDVEVGLAILDAARARWNFLSPPRASKVTRTIEEVTGVKDPSPLPSVEAEAIFTKWLRQSPQP
jgi:hypothetical protein